MQTNFIQVLDRGQAGILRERVADVVFVHMGQLGQSIQRNIFCIVGVQIFFDLCAFLGHLCSCGRHHIHLLAVKNLENQKLQQLLTDGIRQAVVAADFAVHLLKQCLNKAV